MTITEAIDAAHDVTSFDSGEPSLDLWLRDHARAAQAKRVSRTFVLVLDGRVTGFYAISAHRLQREELPRALARGNPAEVPAVLLGKLALARARQGEGLGGALLADALTRIVHATSVVAARFVVVDALHARAASLYEHYGFRRIPDPPRDPASPSPPPPPGAGRLVHKVSDVAASLGLD
jgi:GNAT superfamily N-acetyltransferase